MEKIRENPLVVYVTSSRANASAKMGSDVIPFFIEQINNVPKEKKNIDLLIVSSGGDPMVSWRMINILRERFEKINVLVPYEAFSAATLLALGADEIIMHRYANLGPVDPQITKERMNGPQKELIQFAAEDINHFLDFVKDDVGITNQTELQEAFSQITDELGAQSIGFAKRSLNLTKDLGKKLLQLHMDDNTQVLAIIEALSKSFHHHGFALSRSEAKRTGLKVEDPDEKVAELMWKIWKDIEEEMQIKTPFNPLSLFYQKDPSSVIFSPIKHIDMPLNIPPQIIGQIFNQILQNISFSEMNGIEHELFQATLESLRYSCNYKTVLRISANRDLHMNINIAASTIKSQWEVVT